MEIIVKPRKDAWGKEEIQISLWGQFYASLSSYCLTRLFVVLRKDEAIKLADTIAVALKSEISERRSHGI